MIKLDSGESVSYTHLDVYKRQEMRIGRGRGLCEQFDRKGADKHIDGRNLEPSPDSVSADVPMVRCIGECVIGTLPSAQ